MLQPADKKKILIAALLVLAVVAGYWAYGHFFKDSASAPTVAAKARAAADKSGKSVIVVPAHINMALLDIAKEPVRRGRNIFQSVYKPPQLPPKNVKPATVTVVVPPPPPPPPPPPETQEQMQARLKLQAANAAKEEMGKIKILGFLKRKSGTSVFLSFMSANTIVAKGEKINADKEYYISAIGDDSITISDKATGVDVKILAKEFTGKEVSVALPGIAGGGDKKSSSASPVSTMPAQPTRPMPQPNQNPYPAGQDPNNPLQQGQDPNATGRPPYPPGRPGMGGRNPYQQSQDPNLKRPNPYPPKPKSPDASVF